MDFERCASEPVGVTVPDKWIKGEIKTVLQHKQCGFIRSMQSLPPDFTQRDVYFRLEKADSWSVQVGQIVEFKLNTKDKQKPSASKIRLFGTNPQPPTQHPRHPGIGPVIQPPGIDAAGHVGLPHSKNHVTNGTESEVINRRNAKRIVGERKKEAWSEESSDSETESQENEEPEQHETRSIIPVQIRDFKLLPGQLVGRVRMIKDNFGFISLESSEQVDLYFSVSSVSSGKLAMEIGDEVTFFVRSTKNDDDDDVKQSAVHVHLKKCCHRDVEAVERYLGTLLRSLTEDEKTSGSDYAMAAVTCLPVWDCIGRCQRLSKDAIAMLNTILIELDEKYTMKENITSVLEVLLKTPLFSEFNCRYSQYIEDVLREKRAYKAEDFYKVVLMITRYVPSKIRRIVKILEPLASYKITQESDESIEFEQLKLILPIYNQLTSFLFRLLKLCARSTAADLDDISWDELPLVPSVDELHSGPLLESALNLRRVLKKGPYSSVHDYVDTYFRLLRADCFSALSQGIRDLLNGTLHPNDMNVYTGVQLAGFQITRSGSGMCLGLTFTPHRKVLNWDASSCLLYGNLLCISVSGTFRDPLWATVVSRELLKSHQIIIVEMCNESNSLSDCDAVLSLYLSGKRTVMVESPTYYKAYQPVLKSLQSLDPRQLAFQEELVQCKSGGIPQFLDEQCTFNSRIVYSSGSTLNVESYCNNQLEDVSLAEGILDQSQESAIKQCLKNRVAIVQGPPGTGKTFIGIKLVQILLSLSRSLSSPILVLTYKNHSLDEFLKELNRLFPNTIARVGGRSQEQDIAGCNLNELRKANRMTYDVFQQVNVFQTEMMTLRKEISDAFDSMSENRYLGIETIVNNLSREQIRDFLLQCNWSKCKIRSFKKDEEIDLEKFNKIQKFVTPSDVIEILGKCGESSFQTLFTSGSFLGKNVNSLLEAAVKRWLPPLTSFESLSKTFGSSRRIGVATTGLSNSQASANTNSNPDVDLDEKDAEEIMRERMAASTRVSQTKDEILKEMKLFTTSKDGDKSGEIKLMEIAKEMAGQIPVDVLIGTRSLWDLEEIDRAKLVQCLLYRQYQEAGKKFEEVLGRYQRIYRAKEELEHQHKASILQKKKIVGMTVTGANMHIELVSQMKPEVILVEEAAEVLEPQLQALMGPWVKQLILIGDHKQLRPSVENFKLCKDYHFDISLMERLINNDLPYSILNIQNRMRPEFARLLLDIYPNLQDNLIRVGGNSPANCVGASMYFWNHSDLEISGRTKVNEQEANRAIKLALFLIMQGYRPEQVTILSPYLGQVSLLRRKMKQEEANFPHLFADKVNTTATTVDNKHSGKTSVRIHTVDLYQGDENDFVIISLVRSNAEQAIGFVGILNRRCVAQSRSRCGLYFIGNRQTFLKSQNWNKVIEGMANVGCLGDRIPLNCPLHPQQSTVFAEKADDIPLLVTFCEVTCNQIMPCEKHYCLRPCQPRHIHIVCVEKVDFKFPSCGHDGRKLCGEDISSQTCKVLIPMLFKGCLHAGYRKCFEEEKDVTCPEPCTKLLEKCGHPCEKTCGVECDPDSCSICEKIREEEAKKRREAEEHIRKEHLKQVIEKIKAIEEGKAEEGVHRIALSRDGDTAAEYYGIEDRVKKYVQPDHKWFPQVTMIEKVTNISLELKWLEVQKELFDPIRYELKFHGTNKNAVESIIKDGFRLPPKANKDRSKAHRPMYGRGVYFASDSSKSAQEMYTRGSQMLLVCDVLLGKSKTVEKAEPGMTAGRLREDNYDSVFAKRGTRITGGVLYDEFVIYNPDQAIPRYIVHYDATEYYFATATAAAAAAVNVSDIGASGQNTGIIHYNMLSSQTITEDNNLRLHFRVAESQFLRMIKDTGQEHRMEIQSIDYYINMSLIDRFQKKSDSMKETYPDMKESKHIVMFYSRKIDNLEGVIRDNFQINSNEIGTEVGIYFSECPDLSYENGEEIGKLLLCNVLPGKTFVSETRLCEDSRLQHGYDSLGFNPYPTGRCKELVIFNADLILPCYVINFKIFKSDSFLS